MTLHELIAQKEALERQIEQTKTYHRDDGIAKVQSLMREYGLTVADLRSEAIGKTKRLGQTGKLAAKYRNASTGESWSGRGLQPRWLKSAIAGGKKISDFAV